MLVVALAAAACSGDDDTDATPSTPATTEAPTTTESTVTSTSVADTVPDTTEAPPSTAAETTVASTAPPTTAGGSSTTSSLPIAVVGVDNPDAQAMLADFELYRELFVAMADDPLNDAKLEAVLDRTTQEGTGFVQRYNDILRRDGLAVRRNTELPSRDRIIDASTTIAGDFGAFDVCRTDGDIVVEPGGNPDGTDVIVNDDMSSRFIAFSFNRVDDQWLMSGRETGQSFPDREDCA